MSHHVSTASGYRGFIHVSCRVAGYFGRDGSSTRPIVTMQGITISLDPVRHAGLTPANRGGDYIKRRPIRGPRPNLINFLANCVSFGADFYDNDIPNMSNVALRLDAGVTSLH